MINLKRFGKFTEGRNRTLKVKLDSYYSKRIIFLSLRKVKSYKKFIFFSKDLNPEKQSIENECIQKRRALIGSGIKTKQQRIPNLTLQQEKDKTWVENPACDSELLVNLKSMQGLSKIET